LIRQRRFGRSDRSPGRRASEIVRPAAGAAQPRGSAHSVYHAYNGYHLCRQFTPDLPVIPPEGPITHVSGNLRATTPTSLVLETQQNSRTAGPETLPTTRTADGRRGARDAAVWISDRRRLCDSVRLWMTEQRELRHHRVSGPAGGSENGEAAHGSPPALSGGPPRLAIQNPAISGPDMAHARVTLPVTLPCKRVAGTGVFAASGGRIRASAKAPPGGSSHQQKALGADTQADVCRPATRLELGRQTADLTCQPTLTASATRTAFRACPSTPGSSSRSTCGRSRRWPPPFCGCLRGGRLGASGWPLARPGQVRSRLPGAAARRAYPRRARRPRCGVGRPEASSA
jgi:hypothetical protein